jgi:hypothetical protein
LILTLCARTGSIDATAPGQPPNGTATTSQNPPPNVLASTMRDTGKTERDAEELRLRKRQKRAQAAAGGSAATPGSRADSIAPGTPGASSSLVAPEPSDVKPPTKKEQKKRESLKFSEAQITASANSTLNAFIGRPKKGKTYSWMTPGGSGASTPTRGALPGGGAGTPLASVAAGGAVGGLGGGGGGRLLAERTSLTQEGRSRLGAWRETSEKGKHVQLRDWLAALEEDGRDPRATQAAYDRLDAVPFREFR